VCAVVIDLYAAVVSSDGQFIPGKYLQGCRQIGVTSRACHCFAVLEPRSHREPAVFIAISPVHDLDSYWSRGVTGQCASKMQNSSDILDLTGILDQLQNCIIVHRFCPFYTTIVVWDFALSCTGTLVRSVSPLPKIPMSEVRLS
jgi:hypothetical protein